MIQLYVLRDKYMSRGDCRVAIGDKHLKREREKMSYESWHHYFQRNGRDDLIGGLVLGLESVLLRTQRRK